jgi:hypothetical protein
MQAYREIIDGMKLKDIVNLPETLMKSQVEIIVLPVKPPKRKNPGGKLTQNWAKALQDYKKQYTSVELQKKALEWRITGK